MKKRIIALSVAAALGGAAGVASAQVPPAGSLEFNPDGVGHILIIPYFNVQSGNATLFSIVNTDQVYGKALKIRFRGASNSDDVFDFQLFMSPGDRWSANVSQGANGLAKLETGDRSCTLPSSVNQSFITTRLNTTDLSGDALANETREGYVEILNMGDIPSLSGTTSVWFATKHNSAGVAPCASATISGIPVLETLTQGDTRLLVPTTGLMANWLIINVPNTTTWSGDAAAIEARSNGLPGYGRNVFWPQRADSLALAGYDIDDYTADALFQAGVVDGAYYDLPDLSTPYIPGNSCPFCQANELSDSLATRAVAGEYISSASINATTDWVVSKPTRRYYVGVDYLGTTAAERLVTNYDDNSESEGFYYRSALTDKIDSNAGNTVMGTGPTGNGGKTYQACTQVTGAVFYNSEELRPAPGGIVISPGVPAPAPSLCGEISVLGINSAVSPLGASVSRFNVTLPAGFSDGWGLVTANNLFQGRNLGLPMLVTQFTKATNPAAQPGVSGTYGANWSGRVVTRGDRHPLLPR